jgi:hypothetical protein
MLWSNRRRKIVLTINSRFNPTDIQNLFQILRPEITNSQTRALQGPIFYKILQDLPKLSDLAMLGDKGVVDEEEIGRAT